jgi:flagellar M-ring protein FliF
MNTRLLLSRLSPRGWAVVGGSFAGLVILGYLIMHLASQPSYTTLLTGLDPSQTGKVTSTLDQKGISYQIINGGTGLNVNASQTAQARIALATAGLLGNGSGAQQPGFELFDKSSLGSSNFQQQVTYQRALEGQLDQTIDQVQGVSGATVNLVIPDPTTQVFSDTSTRPTASVLLSGTTTLDPGAVKGIANLVASSVPGLAVDKVTITDSTGQLLWPNPTAGADGSAGGSLLAKQSAEQSYDSALGAQLNSMLAQTLGPGKAQVAVNADLNTNQATQDQLQYGANHIVLSNNGGNETLRSNGAGNTGVAGTAGNAVPTYATTGTGTSNYTNKTANTTYGVDKTVTHTVVSPGAINRQQVSVLVDKSVPAAELAQIQSMVTNAAGIQAARGDTISVGQISFAKQTGASGGASAGGPLAAVPSMAKTVAIGVGALIFLGLLVRGLRRREHEVINGEPVWLREIEAPRALAELEAEQEHPTSVHPLRPAVNPARLQVEELLQRDPVRVADHVRSWLQEE